MHYTLDKANLLCELNTYFPIELQSPFFNANAFILHKKRTGSAGHS